MTFRKFKGVRVIEVTEHSKVALHSNSTMKRMIKASEGKNMLFYSKKNSYQFCLQSVKFKLRRLNCNFKIRSNNGVEATVRCFFAKGFGVFDYCNKNRRALVNFSQGPPTDQ